MGAVMEITGLTITPEKRAYSDGYRDGYVAGRKHEHEFLVSILGRRFTELLDSYVHVVLEEAYQEYERGGSG